MNNLTLETEPGCMNDHDPSSLSIDNALEKISSLITPVSETETVELQHAINRILAEDLVASTDMPAQANSAMDGYAINSEDIPKQGVKKLELIGTSRAGAPFDKSVKSGTCVRIMTGAVLPEGTDTVVIQENTQRSDNSVLIDARTLQGENIRLPGENYTRGDLLLPAGTRLYPAELGLIASLGMGGITVKRKIRAAVFSTGDELRRSGEILDPGCIYDSNRQVLSAMLGRLGIEAIDMGIVKDNKAAIEETLLSAAASADVVIVSGGVSVGDADFTREVLEKTGTQAFWKIAIKPGRPLVFGQVQNAWFFGLPGNPVSSMVTFYQIVQPTLRKLMGSRECQPVTVRAVTTSNLKKRPGRREYQRGILQKTATGEYTVSKTGAQGSAVLTSMTQANCFIVLPVESDGVMAGETVEVQPFYGLM